MFERLTDPDPPSGEDRRDLVRRDGLRRRARRRVAPLTVAAGAVLLLGVAVVQGQEQQPAQDIGVATGQAEDPTTTSTTEVPTTTSTVAVTTPTSTTAATTTTTPTTTPTTHCRPWKSRPGSQPEHLEIVLIPDKPVFTQSEPVTFTLRVRNNGDEPVTYATQSGGGWSNSRLLVRDRTGTLVFDSDHHVMRPDVYTEHTIEPGEERSLKLTWYQNHCLENSHAPPYTMPAGRYVAEGAMKQEWWAPPVAFDVK